MPLWLLWVPMELKECKSLWEAGHLKVITSSKVPFIVVQDTPKAEVFKNIIIPISYRREIKECISWAHFFSRMFNTKFITDKGKIYGFKFQKGCRIQYLFSVKIFYHKKYTV